MGLIKSALVTGGAKRIGRAICETLAEAGYALAIHYNRSQEQAEALAAQLRERGAGAVAVQADLTDTQAVRALVAHAGSDIGPLGLLVNNASIFENDDFSMDDEDLWDAHFDIHVKAPAILTASLARQLQEGTQGLVVNMIDQRVLKPNPRFASYTLSKNTLWTATKTMAQRFAPHMRVNALGPGPTLPGARQHDSAFDAQVEALPMKTGPEPSDFGRSILYLADMPSITGQMITLDGGQHLAWETPDLLVRE